MKQKPWEDWSARFYRRVFAQGTQRSRIRGTGQASAARYKTLIDVWLCGTHEKARCECGVRPVSYPSTSKPSSTNDGADVAQVADNLVRLAQRNRSGVGHLFGSAPRDLLVE